MNIFTLMIGASALFIAGCAAYFSVRGIALTFGAVSTFTVPIIIMASSLEFGKLIAASFLYRNWKTCHPTLRTYLSLAVVLLIGITSAGIYGYLSQAFEQTLSQVQGYEKKFQVFKGSKLITTGGLPRISFQEKRARLSAKRNRLKSVPGWRVILLNEEKTLFRRNHRNRDWPMRLIR